MNEMTTPDPRDDFSYPDPHDIAAEQAVLGSMMLSAAAAETCLQALGADDFYRPAHQMIFAALAGLIRGGERADVLTVKDRLEATGEIGRCGGPLELHTIIASVPAAANAAYYARIVRERAVRRRLLLAARRVIQMAATSDADEAHGLTERALREIEDVRDSGLGDGLTIQTIREFLDVPPEEDEYDWIVPGLLERGDRMILTGMEGAGKSTLFRQLAVTIAAGIHPFTRETIEPRRVMLIDCENGVRHMRRKLRPLYAQARLLGSPVDEKNLWVECRPARMDLALDKDVSWLLRQVSAVRPDIVMIGPLYRLAPRALQTDDEAAPILAALDMIRARDACVLLEAHAGHATGPGGRRDPRPRGSSAFLGWPEFGYGLRWSDDEHSRAERTVDLVAWRGDRDERDWPEMLTAGGEWPWRVYTRPLQIKAPTWGGFNDAAAN
jgi:DnaB-like helicase N terminal domain/AAA domain